MYVTYNTRGQVIAGNVACPNVLIKHNLDSDLMLR